MEAMMYYSGKETGDSKHMQALVEIFEQISVFNEIGYQTSKVAICAALEKIKSPENKTTIDEAINLLHIMMDKCRNASDKIDRLSRSGSIIANKVKKDERILEIS